MIGTLTSIGLFLLKLLILILILGIIILVHEFGHFIWAKKFNVHIYEFSIGMGPLLFTHKGKDKIDYNFRAFPIGGFVSMAGEVYDDDDKIPKKKLLCNRPWYQRLIIMVAGVVNNFILALIVLFLYTCFFGAGVSKPIVDSPVKGSPAYEAGIKANDEILQINGYNISSWDKAQIILYYKNKGNSYSFKVKHENGKIETLKIKPEITKDSDGNETKTFGILMKTTDTSSIFKKIGYTFTKFWSIIVSMVYTIWGLIVGKLSLSSLSGPVGIYTVVGKSVGLSFVSAISYLMYLLALLSVNVGFINILPFPAFDGGHVLFLLIEKIKGSPCNAKIENICHTIGFILIFILMIVVTINDIIKLV